MNNITRKAFLKQSFGIGTALYFMPGMSIPAFSKTSSMSSSALMEQMIKANDDYVHALLTEGESANRHGGRSNGYNFAKFSAAYCCRDSKFFESKELVKALEETADKLMATQRPDGTINSVNLESPPDTGFIMKPLCSGVYILSQKNDKDLDAVKQRIKLFIQNAGEALVVGGIHTPNHRWAVCQVLAMIHRIYPDQRYIDRIDDWLGEGIYMDEDGHYPERSMNYSDVENSAFLTLGRILDRPNLYEAPRKSLEMTYYYMEPNGDLVTTDSRRQDQYSHRSIVVQYLHYRHLAILDQDGKFAHIVKMIEGFPGFKEIVIEEELYSFMDNELLQEDLPELEDVPSNFEKLFKTSSLARIRREDTTATIFGGVDWPLIIASGRSVSPNFFSYRKGKAILWYMRMSANFFSMGHFRSEGLVKEGNKYILHKKLEVPYYQPLPKEERNKDGDYAHTASVDDRFWSKMAFDKRPVSNVKTLDSRITIEENEGKVDVHFEVGGLEGVTVTVELCFGKEGKLKGVEKSADGENYFLPSGNGVFENGGDKISFGPGIKEHERIRGLDGEKYSVHFGSLRTEGNHVYLTGITPFTHTLTFE